MGGPSANQLDNAGKPFDVTELKEADIRAGEIKASWMPVVAPVNQAPMTPEDAANMSKMFVSGVLLSSIPGSWAASDEWNKIFPDYKFDEINEFLGEIWAGKP